MNQITMTGSSFDWEKTRTLSAQQSLNWYVTYTRDISSIPILSRVLAARKQ
jgi:hypothetical protein